MAVETEVRELGGGGHVLVVRILREEKRNAIDGPTARGISDALDRLDDEDDLWVGILTGTPTVFCAGTDLKDGLDATTERGGEYGVIRRARRTPLVAAVEGVAFGGGFEIALACDLVVAGAGARFALPETRRGLVATSGALFRAIRALPPAIATELLVTGAELDAERARTYGMVNRVTDAGGALDGALALAEEIAASSPYAVSQTLAAIRETRAAADELGWRVTDATKSRIRASDDAAEGIAAFFERRTPRWTGR